MGRAAADGGALVARWLAVAVLVAVLRVGLDTAGLHSATMLAALAAGIVVARRWPGRLSVGRRPFALAQAVVGILLGSALSAATLREAGLHWLPVLLTTLATFGLFLGIGALLARLAAVDPATATLAVTPGGASGVVVMARELGGDDRLVAFSQYFRVLIILVLTPMLVSAAFPDAAAPGSGEAGVPQVSEAGVAVLVALVAAGWLGGRRMGLPAAPLLGPLILAGAGTIAFPEVSPTVPSVVRELAFAIIGLQVGLRFTPQMIARARRLLPMFTSALFALLAGSFGIAWLLDGLTSMTFLDAYLATTPGGLTVVAATAYGSGANTGLVVAVQSVRLVALLLLAPLAVRLTVAALSQTRR